MALGSRLARRRALPLPGGFEPRRFASTSISYETDLPRVQLRQANIRSDLRIVGDALQVALASSPVTSTRAEAIVRKLDSGDQLLQLG